MADPEEKKEETDEIKRTPQGFEYRKGKWVPWWAILFVPLLFLLEFLYPLVKNEVNWVAAWGVVILFELMFIPAEHYHLSRGHWVYNEARILGPKIFGMPIEEPFLYMLFSPLIVICIFHAVKKFWVEKSNKGGEK